ncbi:hypothetical protein HMPREF1246_0441 [Acidaminococcus sp. BV3L6]|uniref:Uncharacterized protein n=1 Tax=Acidaminococcus intestini (strain RyC-MR95) TaxID=568816 RepID=G4Q5H7_ACIIR|nr:hypothetical protein Acin_0851 [Acidaminococcus intestini RyC-MR95]ERL18159.1 hypothetical protein HMPREF1246_0441 [Acidaminococcus sp. BV3L6]
MIHFAYQAKTTGTLPFPRKKQYNKVLNINLQWLISKGSDADVKSDRFV